MRPILQCKKLMKELGLDFMSELDRHLAEGWVYSDDKVFVMATVESRESLLGLNLNKNIDMDTWFVYSYVGNLKRVFELIPFKKKFVAFRRNNGSLKIYQMDKLLKKLERL